MLKFFAGVKYFGEVIGVVRPDVDEPDGEDWYKVRYDDEDEEMLDARELLLHARQFREFVAAQPAAMVDAEPNELCGGHDLSVGTLMDMLGVMGGPRADSDDSDDSEDSGADSEVDSDDSDDSGADSEVGEDVAEGAEEHKNEDGVDRRTFPPTKGGSFVAEPRPSSQAGQHGRWSRWDAVLWGCRVNNFESAAGLPVSHVVRSFDKGVHAAAAVALTYPRGVYAPVIRKRPHVYDLQTSEAERNAAVAQFEQQIKAGRFIKSDRPCRRQYDVFAQVSARRGVDAFSDVRVYSALLLPIRTQLLATGLVKVAGGGFAFTKNAAMSKAVTEAIEHHDGQAPHSHPRPSSRVRVRLIVSVSKTAKSAHPLSTRWSPEYGGDLGTKGGGLEFYAPLAASVAWIMYDTNIQQTHCARPAAEDGTRLLCTEDYEVVLPPAEVGDLAALLAALEKLRARIPGIMKAAHPGSVRVQPTTASGGKVAPEMPIAWEKGGLALKPRRQRRRVKAVPLAQAEQHEQQQREQRQRSAAQRDERRQRKRDEQRQRSAAQAQREQDGASAAGGAARRRGSAAAAARAARAGTARAAPSS